MQVELVNFLSLFLFYLWKYIFKDAVSLQEVDGQGSPQFIFDFSI